MSDTDTVAPEAATEDIQAATDQPEADDTLRDAGKKALAAERAARREAEKQAKQLADRLTAPRVAQRVALAPLDRVHEVVGDRYRNVEVRDLVAFLLAVDEFQNVWMVDTEDPHVRAAARAALQRRTWPEQMQWRQ